jgi:hypothetical protein
LLNKKYPHSSHNFGLKKLIPKDFSGHPVSHNPIKSASDRPSGRNRARDDGGEDRRFACLPLISGQLELRILVRVVRADRPQNETVVGRMAVDLFDRLADRIVAQATLQSDRRQNFPLSIFATSGESRSAM